MVFVFRDIEILFKILLFKGGVLIYAEHCTYLLRSVPYFICKLVPQLVFFFADLKNHLIRDPKNSNII